MNWQKIKGGLYGCALGDARGAITEFSTYQQIGEVFQHELNDFRGQPSFYEKGGILGTVTDDFGSSYYLMKQLIEQDGRFDQEVAMQVIEDWSKDAYYFKFSGPTTKKAVAFIHERSPKEQEPGVKSNFVGEATNGAAMKVVPLGILANGDEELAIQYAIDMSYPTHYNSLAVAGACAVCASVANAQRKDATLQSVLKAGLKGARAGKAAMQTLHRNAIGPDLEFRMMEAIKVGEQCHSYEELLAAIDQKVGTNMAVTESIAAVYGILAGVKGDCMLGIKTAVNVGGDTDTMAAIIGGILGSLQGIAVLPEQDIQYIQKQNPGIAIEAMIDQFTNLVEGRVI